jgi:hypothetical protein
MEQLRMDEVDQFSKEELLQRMKARYAKHSKSCRLHAFMWMAFLLILIVLYLVGYLKNWPLVIVPLLIAGSNFSDMLWFGKMSKCDDAKSLVDLYDKGYQWGKVAAVLAMVIVAFFIYELIVNADVENMGLVSFVIMIVLLAAVALFLINFVFFKHSIFKNRAINRLRELSSTE